MAFLEDIHDIEVQAKKLYPQYPWSPFEDYRLTFVGKNAISTCIATCSSNQYTAQVDLIGTEALLMIDLETQSIVTYRRERLTAKCVGRSLLSDTAQRLCSGLAAGVKHALGRMPSTHDALAQQFAQSILDGRPSPVPAADGMESVRILKAVTDQIEKKYDTSMASIPSSKV